jgi:hypothetical protein
LLPNFLLSQTLHDFESIASKYSLVAITRVFIPFLGGLSSLPLFFLVITSIFTLTGDNTFADGRGPVNFLEVFIASVDASVVAVVGATTLFSDLDFFNLSTHFVQYHAPLGILFNLGTKQ